MPVKLSSVRNHLSKKKLLIGLVILIAACGLIFFLLQKGSKDITTTTVKRSNLESELVLSGEMDANEKVKLQFPLSGKVTWVGVKEGDTIQKGQGLASLDQRTAQKNLQASLIDYSKERNVFEQSNLDQQAIKPSDALNDRMKKILQNYQYDLDKAVISVELQDLAKQEALLSSPIEGIVTRADIPFAGQTAVAGTSTFEIVNPASIYFAVSVDQTEVNDIKKGNTAKIFLDAYPDETVSGNISDISFSPKTDESGTVYKVKLLLAIDNSQYKYRLGMTGDATFVTEKKVNALYLPVSFVKSDDEGSYVFINEKKEKKYIKTGIETDENIEIVSGLSEGDTIYD